MKRVLLCLLAVIPVLYSSAQSYSSSPFSSKGLGEWGTLTDPIFGALGNASTAVYDSMTVNTYNPASYASLSKGQPLFSAGVSGRISLYSQSDNTKTGYSVGLNNITMVVPANKYIGFAIGLRPAFRKGYETTQYATDHSGDYKYIYQGSGIGQEVFGGLGANLLKTARHEWSIGANVGYIFGEITDRRFSLALASDGVGGAEEKKSKLHALNYSFGTAYTYKFNTLGHRFLRVAAVYQPQQSYSATRERELYLIPGVDSDTSDVYNTDTYVLLDSMVGDRGHFVQPATLSFGFSYMFTPEGGLDYKHKSIYQIGIYGDFTQTMWKNYSEQFSTVVSSSYMNSNRVSLGVMFTPNYNWSEKVTGQSYLKRARYRIGTYFGNTPYSQNGVQVREIAGTLGIGLPMGVLRSNSSVNFSMQYGTRGTGRSGDLNERFFAFGVGFIFAPAPYERWFVKRKVD